MNQTRSRLHSTKPGLRIVLLLLCMCAPLAADELQTTLVSQSSQGVQGNGGSLRSNLSADGRLVVFHSNSDNLAPGITNDKLDVFVRDTQSGLTTRVSLGLGGVEGDGDCIEHDISADGSTVAWSTFSKNLVPGDTNNVRDIFVRDLATGFMERVSVSSAGVQANFHCRDPQVSADGRMVAFASSSSNLVPGDNNNASDIFVHDRVTGITSLVSRSDAGIIGNGDSAEPCFSDNGSFLAYSSIASNLVAGDLNLQNDVFLCDIAAGVTTLVSVTQAGIQGDSGSRAPRMTPDHVWIAFETGSSTFSLGDTNGVDDVYLVNTLLGSMQRVSLDASGVQSIGICTQPSISANGRYLTMAVEADDLDAQDTNGAYDTYRKDRVTGELRRVSLGPNGQQDDIGSGRARISADGTKMVFYTNATTFNAPDLNGFEADVYMATCVPLGTPYCTSAPNSTGLGAAMEVSGSLSTSSGTLILRAYPVPDDTFLFLGGPAQADLPFGHGRLCVGGSINRLGLPAVAAGGLAELAFAPSSEAIGAGLYHFQCWYRDPAAGGAAFNASNGYTLTLLP